MDAWIACMSHFDETEYELTGFNLSTGETLMIEVVGAESFAKRLPDVLADFCVYGARKPKVPRLGRQARTVTLTFL